MVCAKLKKIFESYSEHLEECHPFRDVLRPYFVEYEPDDLENYDAETKVIDEELGSSSLSVEKALDHQNNDIVNVTSTEERDQ